MSPPNGKSCKRYHYAAFSCNQLNNTAGFLDLLLSFLAEVPCLYDNWDLWDSALAQNLGVTEWEEVDDRGCVFLFAGDVGIASLNRNKGPELRDTNN